MKFLKRFKLYTHKEVVNITKNVIEASAHGTIDWIKYETDIVDIHDKVVIKNAEIDMKKGAKTTMEYIKFELAKRGIVIEN